MAETYLWVNEDLEVGQIKADKLPDELKDAVENETHQVFRWNVRGFFEQAFYQEIDGEEDSNDEEEIYWSQV